MVMNPYSPVPGVKVSKVLGAVILLLYIEPMPYNIISIISIIKILQEGTSLTSVNH